MERRSLLIAGAAALSAPWVLKSYAQDSTPVVNGKRVRRRLSTLADDDPFFTAYGKAIEAMHKFDDDHPLSWRSQAKVHADHCEHGTLEFLPWHRPYLHYFEQICGRLINDDTFALPYWDWRDNNGRLPAPFFENGNPLNVLTWNDSSNYNSVRWGPVSSVSHRFATATTGLRENVQTQGDFTETNLENIQTTAQFDLFSELLENPHGTAHVFVGGAPGFLGNVLGHMSHGMSPLDPVFWLHHANVDRMWAESAISSADQIAAMSDADKIYEDMFIDADGELIDAPLIDTFDLDNFGVTYDVLESDLVSEERLALDSQALTMRESILEIADSQNAKFLTTEPNVDLIGATEVDDTTVVGAIERIFIEPSGIGDILQQSRVIRKNSSLGETLLGLGKGRVIARFKKVTPLEGSAGGGIKVFVNCPYLSDATPTSDPHFAGSLSFFGCPPEICATRNFSVDITSPLRRKLEQGGFDPSKVELQLLAARGPGSEAGTPFARIQGAELLSV